MNFESYREECIKHEPNRVWIDKFNEEFPHSQLITEYKNKKIHPVFVAGHIDTIERPIVTFSLNPKFDDYVRKQPEVEREIWFNNGLNYFDDHPKIHTVFNNIGKLIIGKENWQKSVKKRQEILTKNFVNFDWCCYFSEHFGTIDIESAKAKSPEIKNLFEFFDESFKKALNIQDHRPKLIIIHGKSLNEWVQNHIQEIDLKNPDLTFSRNYSKFIGLDRYIFNKKNEVKEFQVESKKKKEIYSLWKGKYDDIPVIFIDRFINKITGGDRCLKIFGDYIRHEFREILKLEEILEHNV